MSIYKRQARALRENWGRGSQEDYIAFVRIARHGLPSLGVATRQPSPFLNRVHEVMSNLERDVLLNLFSWNPYDIWEGYRLETEGVEDEFANVYPTPAGTTEIAKMLGLRIPRGVMSTDFVVTMRNGRRAAINCKYRKEVNLTRFVELRRIEEEYHRQRGVAYVLLTEAHVCPIRAENLAFASSALTAEPGYRVATAPEGWIKEVLQLARRGHMPMGEILRFLEAKWSATSAQQAVWLKYGVLLGQLPFDLSAGMLTFARPWPIRSWRTSKDGVTRVLGRVL